MSAFLFALALLAQDPSGAEPPPPETEAAAAEPVPYPAGAPKNDYGLVSWCYGALSGYVDLKPQVMPEVTRIETTFRAPGRTIAEDLQVYEDLEKESRANLKLFARAMEAAEKASMRAINAEGGEAVKRGRATWAAAPNLAPARLAQEWMSWSLPARCVTTAEGLEKRARLLGATFDPTAATVEAEPAQPIEPESVEPESNQVQADPS